MHPVKILLVDDDTDLVDWLGYAFRRDGYKVYTATNGEAATRLFETQAPDVVVLDLVMPRRDGMEVLRDIRKQSNAPVILLTAVGDEEHVIKALKSGADDYVIKPFRPRELRARVEAVLRRAQAAGQARPAPQEPLHCGNIALDPGLKEVTVGGEPVALSRIEFALLEHLMLNLNRVVSITDNIANVWGYEGEQNEDVVRVNVSRLRRKIEADPSQPRYLINVPGEGYALRDKP